MLEIAVTVILEVVDLFVALKDPQKKSKKFIKGLIRFYWILERIEEHSSVFIEGLEVILEEKRIPARLEMSIKYLDTDLAEVIEMLGEEQWGPFTNFWHILDIVGYPGPVHQNKISKEFHGIIGLKLARIFVWQNLLKQVENEVGDPETSQKFIILTNRFAESGYARMWDWDDVRDYEEKIENLQTLLRTEKVKIIDLNDSHEVKDYLESAKRTQIQIKQLKEKLGEIIKTKFTLSDLVDAT